MAELTSNKKSKVEIVRNMDASVEYLVVDGIKCGIIGFVSEEEREKTLKMLNDIYNESGSIFETVSALRLAATCHEKEISPDCEISVDGVSYIVSYENNTAYTMDGNEVVNLNDLNSDNGILPDLSPDQVNRIISDRIMLEHSNRVNSDREENDECSECCDFCNELDFGIGFFI